MSSNGQGLPTPPLIRSMSFRQCVVASPNLSETKHSVHAVAKSRGFLSRSTRLLMAFFWRRVGFRPVRSRSSNEVIFCSWAEPIDKFLHVLVKRRCPRNDDAGTDSSLGM